MKLAAVAADWRENLCLQDLLSLRLKVRARWFASVGTERELADAAAWARGEGLPLLLLGGGTNTVLRRDFPGLVVQVALRGLDAQPEQRGDGVLLRVGAGEDWPTLVRHCLAQGWYGLENLSLIPGLAGAAPVRNIGAYGVELSDLLEAVEVMHLDSGRVERRPAAELGLCYRRSLLFRQQPLRLAVTAIHLRLHRTARVCTEHPALQAALAREQQPPTPERMAEIVCHIRTERLPDPAIEPNVGSFFTNPIVGEKQWRQLRRLEPELPWRQRQGGYQVAAAHLIEAAGWKGRCLGGARVSEQHALVLLNDRNASGEQVMALAEAITAEVADRYGVQLEPEPCIH